MQKWDNVVVQFQRPKNITINLFSIIKTIGLKLCEVARNASI